MLTEEIRQDVAFRGLMDIQKVIWDNFPDSEPEVGFNTKGSFLRINQKEYSLEETAVAQKLKEYVG